MPYTIERGWIPAKKADRSCQCLCIETSDPANLIISVKITAHSSYFNARQAIFYLILRFATLKSFVYAAKRTLVIIITNVTISW